MTTLSRILIDGVWVGLGAKDETGLVAEVPLSSSSSYRRKPYTGYPVSFSPGRGEGWRVEYILLFHSDKAGESPWRVMPVSNGSEVVHSPDNAVVTVDLRMDEH